MVKMVKRIWEWIKRDGLLHIESCALIVIVFSLITPIWVASSISLIAGICKELWDTKYGVPSWHDIICDVIGIALGVLISIV